MCAKIARKRSVLLLMELYDHRIRQGVSRYAREHGWFVTFCDGCIRGGSTLLPQGWSGDGILTQISSNPQILEFVQKHKVPCVDLCIFRPDVKLPRVTGNQYMIGAIAAEHLIERGFTQGVFFATEDLYPHQQREAGFCETYQKKCNTTPLSLVWARQSRNGLDNWSAQAKWIKHSLSKIDKPVGVFCYSDYDAVKIESASIEAGYLVPDDVAIVGVDNDQMVCEITHVPLSSVRHDLVGVGYEGAALLDKLLHKVPYPSEPVLVDPQGVEVRASSDTFSSTDPVVRSVIGFFRANLNQKVGVNEAAATLGLTAHALKSHFRSYSRESIYNLLLQMRLLKAQQLLRTTSMSVKEIAALCGFCHAQHLNRAFREKVGSAPQAFRLQEHSRR